jgi:hypothetical protein
MRFIFYGTARRIIRHDDLITLFSLRKIEERRRLKKGAAPNQPVCRLCTEISSWYRNKNLYLVGKSYRA